MGAATAVCAVIISIVNVQRTKKLDDKKDGARESTVLVEIGYIKSGIDDLKRENKEVATKVNALAERIIRCEESCSQTCRRIDRIEKVGGSGE